MDADLSHDPNEIPKMIDILETFSFVIGSRYIKGGKCEMSDLDCSQCNREQIYQKSS